MQIIVDEKRAIIAYAIAGGLVGGIDYNGDVPIDFIETFKPSFYKLESGEKIVQNTDYVPATPVVDGPSDEMLAINALGLQVAKLIAEKGGE